MMMIFDELLANLILEQSIERIYVKNMYGDIPSGIYLVRGENVVFMGEIVSLYHLN
jgi:U6 snRNA-associated Sm-like protein LSm1